MVIEEALKNDPVNGDLVRVKDPTDPSLTPTLNNIYQRLSKSTKLKYPAPFETVHKIEEHVNIAFELYLDDKEYKIFKYLESEYRTFMKSLLDDIKKDPSKNDDGFK